MASIAQALVFGMSEMYNPMIQISGSPIFIPRKHPKLKYADHKRMKAKRKNKQRRK